MKERIHIDMDHCAVDFERGKQEWLAQFPDEKLPHSHLQFWINLKPMPGFLESLERLEETFDVYLLTAPSLRNTTCWTGKAIWVFNNLGYKYLSKLIQSYDKGQFSGAYLIDDGNQNGQDRYNGEHIQFGHSEEFSTWQGVINYINRNYALDINSDIPAHIEKEASAYIESRVLDMRNASEEEFKSLVKDGIQWALKKMKQSYPTIEKTNRGHNYKPPFYKR